MFTSVFLSLIYLLFPLSVYFLYMVYSKATYEKERLVFFDLALFTSYYLCSKFGKLSITSAFLINIPLVFALYKKRFVPSLILSFGISFFLAGMYNVLVYAFFLNYLIVLLFTFVAKTKIVNVFLITRVIFDFLIIILFPNDIMNIKMIDNFVITWVLIYVVFNFAILFYDKIQTIVMMHYSLEELTKEKKLYESLFKITHEIKNPLAVCKGYLDMFDVKNPGKANRYIGIIGQEINRTLVLLQDFANASKLNIEKSKMDITLLVEDVCDESKLIFRNNLMFDYKISNKDLYINGDYNRLKQVLINVIKNAKEAIGENGAVFLDAKKANDSYAITIKDNGIGMDKETIKNIGTAFYTTKKSGTGLGVCFSKEIIEKHNGTMDYFSKVGKGTTVKIVLPLYKKH